MAYTPFKVSDADTVDSEPMVDTSRKYLDKIVELCNEENIKLILVNIPCDEPIARYKSTKEYAESRGIAYYDFNEAKLYNKIDYNASENLLSHPNYLGAEKISLYIGKLLLTEYNVPPREDNSYDLSRNLYDHKIKNIKLVANTDIYQYLEMINDDKYSIFIFAPTGFSAYIDDEIMNKLFMLGFTTDLRGIPDGTHYCAVKDSGNITERMSEGNIVFSGSIRDGLTVYDFNINTSVMYVDYQTFSMIVDGVECGNQSVGLNIVVYDNKLKMIIDKVNFNTNVAELIAMRY